MKNKKLFLGGGAVVLVVIIVVAMVMLMGSSDLPQPTAVEVRMYGVEVTMDGQVVGDGEIGEIILRGERMQGTSDLDRFMVDEMKLLDLDDFCTEENTQALAFIKFCQNHDYEEVSGTILRIDNDKKEKIICSVKIFYDLEEGWCIAEVDGRYFVGSTNEDFDPQDIMAKYPSSNHTDCFE